MALVDPTLGINDGKTAVPMGFGGLARTVDIRDFNLGSYQPPITIPAVFKQFVGNIPGNR